MLLKTKLYTPQAPTNFVPRPRLLQQLDNALHNRLTIVRAPAGFGKTTLVADWVAVRKLPTGWLSLDSADSDPSRFTRHLIAAARQISPTSCGAIDLHDLSNPLSLTDILPIFINDLADLAQHSILVLDDYHLVDSAKIQAGIGMLLEHTPINLHLIMTARGIPALTNLPRLRVRGQMVEIDSADLRFTPSEAAQFLSAVGLNLSASQVATLEERTEGWIAGLQLAAVSMHGREDIAGFIDALSGRHQYIVDYLAEEALGQSSAEIQQFLLETCVLDRLNASLCNAVTQREDSQRILNQLHRQSLFIIPLDDHGEWYRYHHFFDDFLAAQLERTAPATISALNRRAAAWFLQKNEPRTAIEHLLKAQDFAAAVEQISLLLPQMVAGGETNIVAQWLAQIPTAVIDASPALLVGHALIRVQMRDLRTAETAIEKVQTQPDLPPFLTAVIALIQSQIALMRDQLPTAIDRARASLDLLELTPLRTHVAYHLLTLYSLTGDLVAMRYVYDDLAATTAPSVRAELNQLVEQGDSAIALGLLHDAARRYRQGIQLAGFKNLEGLPIVGAMRVGLGRVLLEWGEWESAELQIKHGLTLLANTTLHGARIVGMTNLHRVLQQRGDTAAAAAKLAEAGTLIRSFNISQLNALFAAVEAEFALNRGDKEAASRWLRDCRLPIEGELVHFHTAEYRVLAQVLLAHERVAEAIIVLSAIEAAAREAEQQLLLVEALTLRGIGLARIGKEEEAVAVMRDAVESAESEGYIRPFLNHPAETTKLLQKVQKTDLAGFLPDYVDDLLNALGVTEPLIADGDEVAADAIPLLNTLTDRELDVLTYLVRGYSNQAIADAMFVAVSTTRTHLRNLYAKLDARSRTHAIARARELHLVSE